MSDALWAALLSGPVLLILDRTITWVRNRKHDDAVTGLTIDQRWQAWADELKAEIQDLRERVSHLEDELTTARDRIKGLLAEVEHYRDIARAMARHVLRLRSAWPTVGEPLPATPTDVEDALVSISFPEGS